MSNIDSLDSPFIKSCDDEHYQEIVVDNSQSGPVLVNFWSKKAGPCLRQYPILDKIIHQHNGKILLVNINAERVFKITRTLGISSLPTLKLYRHGEVIDTRHGFQSEDELNTMLAPHLVRDSDAKIKQAVQLYSEEKVDAALQLLANAIVDDPENIRLPLTIAKLLQHQHRFQDALDLLRSLPEKEQKNTDVQQLIQRQRWLILATDIEDLELLQAQIKQSPDDLESRAKYAAHLILMQDYSAGLAELLTMMTIDAAFNDAFARYNILQVFKILDAGDPLIDQYRQAMTKLQP